MKNTPTSSTLPGFRRLGLSLALAAFLAPAAALSQTTTTWTGGGGDNNWGTGANWGGSPPPTGSSSDLVFAGTTRTNPFNNYTAFDNFRNIFFASGAGNFSITGNAIGLFGKIENLSASNQTFALDIAARSTIEINPVSGNLTINSANIYLDGNQLRVFGNNSNMVTFSTGTVIQNGSGAGSVALLQNSTMVMAGNNTYTGGTTIGAGRLVIATNYTTNASGVHTAGAIGLGSLTLSNGVTIVADQGSTIRTNISTTTFLKGDVTIGATNSAGLRLAGAWDMDGTTRTITLGKASTGYASGLEVVGFVNPSNNYAAPSFSNGTLVLATTNGSASTPSVARFNTANFVGNAGLTVGDGVGIVSGSGSFFGTGNNAPALTLNADAGRGGGILQMGDGISGGNAVTRSAVVYSLSGGGTVTSANTTGTATTGTLTITNGNGATFSGTITETGGTGIIAFAKGGAGIQILSGSNSYTGATAVNGGGLTIANNSALGATNGATTVASGAALRLSNGITVAGEALTISGTGQATDGALLSISGDNKYLGEITLGANPTYVGASSGADLTISNVNAGANEFWVVGAGTTTVSGGVTNSGSGTAFVKTNTGTVVLMASNKWDGAEFIREGTVVLSNNNALGTAGTTTLGAASVSTATATLQLGSGITNSNAITVAETGTGTRTLSYAAGTGTGAQLGSITLNTNSLAFNIASGGTLLFGGGVTVNTNASSAQRLAIDGGGTLIVTNNGSGISSNDRYQVRVGNGTLIIGSGTIIGRTNVAGLGHGLDLGVDLNGSIVSATSSIRASNSVTVSNAIFVSTTGGNARVLGASGANAAVTFSGPIGLSGTTALTLDATNGQNVAVSGAITNFTGGTGSLVKIGGGTATLSGANTFTGKTTVSGGTLSISAANGLGTAPGGFVADQLTLNGGTLQATANVNLSANQGVTLGSSGGAFDVASGQQLTMAAAQVVTGPGSLTKTGAGTLQLNAQNTYSGGTFIGGGAVRIGSSAQFTTNGSGVLTAGTFGTGNVTLSNGTALMSDGGTTRSNFAPKIILNGNVTLGDATLTGRLQFSTIWDLGGAARTITLGKASTSYGSGNEVVTFITNYLGLSQFENGSLVLATTTGSASTPSIARFTGAASFTTNTSLTVGDGVAISSGGGNFFATGGNAPALTLNADITRGGGVLQLGDGGSTMRNAEVYSLSGGGTVSGSNIASGTSTGTLTINNGGGANFSGNITQGSFGVIALTKTGSGTQTLSGTNSYTGATTLSVGTLVFGRTSARASGTTVNAAASTVVGLGVGGSGYYSEADVSNLFANTLSGFSMNATTGVAIDTTAGNFTYSTNENNGRTLTKLGANTLTLTGTNNRSASTFVRAGTLKLDTPTGGGALQNTASVTVDAGAKLLIAQSDQIRDAAGITLSGGTIERGSGVSETMGNLDLTAASTINFGGAVAPGTLRFGTYEGDGTPDFKLTVTGFALGNSLVFGNDISSWFNTTSFTGTSFTSTWLDISGMEGAPYGGFRAGWDSGSSTFTITSVPEPSTVLAAIGLTGLLGWPVLRRRLRRRA